MANVKKILFYSLGGLILGGVAFIIIKNNKDKNKSTTQPTASTNSTGGTLPTNGNNSNDGTGSLSRLPFPAMAAKLYFAFQGFGTNFSDVKDVLQLLQNQTDWNALVNEYGEREISVLGTNPFGYFWPPFTGNLPETLRDELSASEISAINSIFRNKGIQQI